MKQQYDQFDSVRKAFEKKRDELYSTNYLDKAYRGFAPVAAMYGYLTSGRCTSVYGHGGIIDTFVHDQQFSILNQKLDVIIDKLDSIRHTQVELVRAIEKNNAETRALRNEVHAFSSQQRNDNDRMMQCQQYANSSIDWIRGIQIYQALR